MEEILASIRRIISEDDAPASSGSATPPGAVQAAPEPEPELEPEAQPEPEATAPEEEEDVLELTEPADPPPLAVAPAPPQPEPAPAMESVGDLDVFTTGSAPPEPAPRPAPPVSDDALVTGRTAEAAAAQFGQLAQSIAMPREGRTLEDVVRELLRPLLKDWLDRNLPAIVEARVQAEVERISRTRNY
jgi:cell pole-organizing protein PopZ